MDKITEFDGAVATGNLSKLVHTGRGLDPPLFMQILPSSTSSWLRQIRTVSFLRLPRTEIKSSVGVQGTESCYLRTNDGVATEIGQQVQQQAQALWGAAVQLPTPFLAQLTGRDQGFPWCWG